MPTPLSVNLCIDPSIDVGGCATYAAHDSYVESYWLPLLGPTSWALLRYVHTVGEDHLGAPEVYDTEQMARSLGVNAGTAYKALVRLSQFRLCAKIDAQSFRFADRVRRLDGRELRRLPAFIAQSHREDYPV